MAKWRLLTNHALALIHTYQNPRSTLREIAQAVGITERATLSILRQLEEEELVSRVKEGRQNRYTVHVSAILQSQALDPYTIEELVRTLKSLADQFRSNDGPEFSPD